MVFNKAYMFNFQGSDPLFDVGSLSNNEIDDIFNNCFIAWKGVFYYEKLF